MYGDQYIDTAQNTIHLGIQQDARLNITNRITERCQKAKNSFFAMIGLGVHPLGLNPITSKSLYQKVIMPCALYGSELWNGMSQNEINTVNILFNHLFIHSKLDL